LEKIYQYLYFLQLNTEKMFGKNVNKKKFVLLKKHFYVGIEANL